MWPDILAELENRDRMLPSFLQGTRAWFDGRRVLIECSAISREFLRKNKSSGELIKKVIEEKTGVHCGIGPYQPPSAQADAPARKVEEVLADLQSQGVSVSIDEKS